MAGRLMGLRFEVRGLNEVRADSREGSFQSNRAQAGLLERKNGDHRKEEEEQEEQEEKGQEQGNKERKEESVIARIVMPFQPPF